MRHLSLCGAWSDTNGYWSLCTRRSSSRVLADVKTMTVRSGCCKVWLNKARLFPPEFIWQTWVSVKETCAAAASPSLHSIQRQLTIKTTEIETRMQCMAKLIPLCTSRKASGRWQGWCCLTCFKLLLMGLRVRQLNKMMAQHYQCTSSQYDSIFYCGSWMKQYKILSQLQKPLLASRIWPTSLGTWAYHRCRNLSSLLEPVRPFWALGFPVT